MGTSPPDTRDEETYEQKHNFECISTIASCPGPGNAASARIVWALPYVEQEVHPPPGHLELPPALVRDRTAARRPRPRDAAAHRGPDGALLAPGHGGIRARDRHAGHHLLHPPGDQDDHRRRADRAGAGGAG